MEALIIVILAVLLYIVYAFISYLRHKGRYETFRNASKDIYYLRRKLNEYKKKK